MEHGWSDDAPALDPILVSSRKDVVIGHLLNYLWGVLDELAQLIERYLISNRVPRIEFDNHRVIRMQRHLVLDIVGKLEKR